MKYQRGFSIPKHGSWSPVTRGMPVTRESNQDSKTGGNGDTTEKSLLKKKRIAHRNRIVQSRKSWTPVTPKKVKNGRLDIIPVERQPENENWQDLVGKYTGLLKDETMKRDEKSELYFKSNDPANWKCNDLASVVCSKSSIEAHNNEIHLSDKRRITFKRCTYTLGTQKIAFITNGSTSKDEASSSTTTDSFPIAPITPAKQNDIQRVPENANSPTNGDSPPTTVSTTQKDEQEIDLTKTPQQKTPTRRKRHRPRVIKPKKDPKDGTTPGTPRVKRKYVRKNSVNSNTPDTQQKTPGTSVVKRKYVRKKKNIDQVKSQPQNTADNPPVKSCKKKLNFDLDINLNVNPQDTEQERRINNNKYISTHHVMNILARNMNGYHHNLVPSTIQQIQQPNLPSLDERRGIKRQNSAMDSLFLYKRLLLGVAQRSHNHNIFLENYKKRKIIQQSGFQPSSLVHGNVYNGSPMKLLHSCGQIVNPTSQPPVFVMQPLPNTIIPNEGFTYGVITYPAALLEKRQSEVNGLRVDKGGVSIDDVIYKLERMHICDDSKKGGNRKELVLFRGSDGNAMVPFEPIRKRIQRPKVDLDPETDRLWKLLMAKEGSEGGGGGGGGETLDKDKEKWWENERKVFRGRADSFIARMHLVQGDRRFSRWKGSVVDSVIGVFLTQNVSDHLSSSAFMALAAKFPVKTSSQDEGCETPKEVEEKKVTIKTEPGSEDSIESTTSQTVDETRSTSAPKSNSEPEDVKTEQKQDSNPTVDEGTTPIKVESNSQEQPSGAGEGANTSKEKKRIDEDERNRAMNWDSLRQQAVSNSENKEKSKEDARDSIDYEAFRHAPVNEISDVIKERGMNNLLADRMKYFLNRLVSDHGKIDLEWLRDAPPEKAKDYLLSFRGLGLKSVECIRLLTLHHLAFPVDTNVARISVRLGWVPLQPLPESLQLHLLEMYPVLDSIQKYLWPRLCKLDQLTLYELHYQMITFGKIFCTKSKPNCNACPMRTECRHFASAFASARLSLPGPEEKKIVTTNAQIPTNPIITPLPLEGDSKTEEKKCEPIIEEPTTPEPETTEVSLSDIEDQYYEDSDEIPTIKLNMEQFTTNLQNIMQNSKELQGDDMSKALVALSPKAAYIPIPKLKDVGRLRTEHQVYELPDSHRLLEGLEKREPDDPSPYLLAIWTPGETANSVQPPERECPAQETGSLCDKTTCFSCNSIKEANSQVVRGTILIPCRTAMRGSFPLNGTYFQVNEMFADHASSLNPIDVPRSWIWNLPRRTVYFGTSVSTIFRGLSTQGIQYCFWKGFVCVRGFDRETRAPRPLMARLHFPASKLIKIKSEGK